MQFSCRAVAFARGTTRQFTTFLFVRVCIHRCARGRFSLRRIGSVVGRPVDRRSRIDDVRPATWVVRSTAPALAGRLAELPRARTRILVAGLRLRTCGGRYTSRETDATCGVWGTVDGGGRSQQLIS